MSIPVCRVRAIVNNSKDGTPVAGARVHAQLSSYEVYQGYVVPQFVEGITDSAGQAFLDLWPNQLGAAESYYTIKILSPNGKSLKTTAVIPNVSAVDLHTVAELPPYDGKNDGQLFIDDAVVAGAVAIEARNQAQGYATAAGESANSAANNAYLAWINSNSAAASATDAQNSATAANTSAGSAWTSANNASASATAAQSSQGAAAGSAAASAGSATSASNSASSASGSAQAASASATTAQGAAQSAQNSASTATLKADEASNSAAGAANSAGAAATSANAASSSATSAAQSAAQTGLKGAAVVGDNLIVTRGDNTQYNAGNVRGPVGPQGAGITLKGSVQSISNLPSSGNSLNDAYLVRDNGHLYAWSGSAWIDIGQFQGPPGTTDYNALANKPALGTAAPLNVPASAGVAAAAGEVVRGDDPRMSNARAPTAHSHASSEINDASSVGRAVMTATDAAAARVVLGAGTSSFSGAWSDITGKPAVIAAGANQATARAAIGAGTSNFDGAWASLTGPANAPTAAYRAGDAQIANMAALLAQAGNLKSYKYVGSPAAILANQSGVMLLLGQSGTYTMPSAGSIPTGDAFYFSANSDGTVISIGSDVFAPGGGSTATLNAGESITLVSAGPGFWIRLSDTTRLNKATANALAAKADQSALAAHTSNGSNPHGVTKAQVGLGSVDNTSDASKPISTATQAALDGKANLSGANFAGGVAAAGIFTTSNTTGGFYSTGYTNSGGVLYSTVLTASPGSYQVVFSAQHFPNNWARWEMLFGGVSAFQFYNSGWGEATAGWRQSSDGRDKYARKVIEDALKKVRSLVGLTYLRDGAQNEATGEHLREAGLIAQDVERVLPEAVSVNESGKYKLAYSSVIPLLVNAINEMGAKVEALEAKLGGA